MSRSRNSSSLRGQRLEPFSRAQLLATISLFAVFFGTMTAWSSFAPIGSAVIAPGVVSVESHRKAIQHLEGGIVNRILVKDGSRVKPGDVVVELRDIAITANVDRLKSQYYEAVATTARLTAERDGASELKFSDEILKAAVTDTAAKNAVAAQRKLFQSRNELNEQKLSGIAKKIDRLAEQRDGLTKQLKALDAQMAVREQEEKDATALFNKQLARKSRVLDAQRSRAELDERGSELASELAQAEQQMTEQELKKTELNSANLTAVVEDLRARQARAHELSRELIAAQDILARSQIRAPIEGTVVGLQVHSRDGVISPGQTLMEIVPLTDKLVVEARVRPEDIEEVRAGLPATVVLNTLTRRYSQPIRGTVESVTADRLVDKLTSRPYYGVRISLEAASLDPSESKLLAGMSADTFIVTGERTPLAYLTAPLVRTFNRGMREQ
ncbi:MAG: HlyD family type I secretion periplasmic adaptor subunit [Hyphomicrobium aestuarii]|nr:HlyD family type I secretion periplasmic adaptor subunit [Hyphomicrobium aestuarii]